MVVCCYFWFSSTVGKNFCCLCCCFYCNGSFMYQLPVCFCIFSLVFLYKNVSLSQLKVSQVFNYIFFLNLNTFYLNFYNNFKGFFLKVACFYFLNAHFKVEVGWQKISKFLEIHARLPFFLRSRLLLFELNPFFFSFSTRFTN